MKRTAAVLFAVLCSQAALPGAPRWEMQYFLDEKDRSITFTDIVFPSAQRGIAAGVLLNKGETKPIVMVTSNGGAAWTQVEAPNPPLSLFCLDETACWMVGPKGIWFSDEVGRTWKRIKRESGLLRVYFLTREHGWALGVSKKLLETKDGGKTWTKVAAAEELKMNADRTVFHAIVFGTPKDGLITARSEPARDREDVPIWMDTTPNLHRERPAMSALLETRDAGQTWTSSGISMFGRISTLATSMGLGVALGLVEFDRMMEYPSEVYRFDLRNGNNARVFRRKDVAVTDVEVARDGTGLLAGFQPVGQIARSPIPGKVKVVESTDLKLWTEMEVDYRAVAHRVYASVVDRNHMWIATDTGMILKLTL